MQGRAGEEAGRRRGREAGRQGRKNLVDFAAENIGASRIVLQDHGEGVDLLLEGDEGKGL